MMMGFSRLVSSIMLGLLLLSTPAFALGIETGAQQMKEYLPLLKGKRVALLINQTSVVDGKLLLDTLLAEGVQVVKVFVPEHGFRGTADAGAHISNEVDARTGLPVISLYGKNKKPTREQLADIDILVYDLQDVGARFYTYISTLQYAMEACGETNKTLLILDRPNPNGHLVDGPVLDTALRSFVGMQPIPLLYGMTSAEYAQMLVGEAWIPNTDGLNMKTVPCKNYTHSKRYELPVAPSPNLRTMTAVYLYPGLCLFEGTAVSLGRGTDKPFQQWGHPDFKGKSKYSFIPKSMGGASKPVLENQQCYGELMAANADAAFSLTKNGIDLAPLLKAYQWSAKKEQFFNSFFEKLAGTSALRQQVISGMSEADIRNSWAAGLDHFRQIRKKYLLYAD